MATVQRAGTQAGECRRCRTFCDKLIEPRGCIEIGCRFLYSYEDQLTGGQFMGCLQKVFRAEIDVDMFELAEATGGFGGIKMTGEPLPQCQFRVEPVLRGRRRRVRLRQPALLRLHRRGPRGLSAPSTCARSWTDSTRLQRDPYR